MNREILFRGKRVDNGEWVYGVPIQSNDGLSMIRELYHVDGSEYNAIEDTIIPETVGQFTGLTDKNGTKIFEGDMVKGLHGGKYVCVFRENGAFEFKNLLTLNFVMLQDIWGNIITGNIHDNPAA